MIGKWFKTVMYQGWGTARNQVIVIRFFSVYSSYFYCGLVGIAFDPWPLEVTFEDGNNSFVSFLNSSSYDTVILAMDIYEALMIEKWSKTDMYKGWGITMNQVIVIIFFSVYSSYFYCGLVAIASNYTSGDE